MTTVQLETCLAYPFAIGEAHTRIGRAVGSLFAGAQILGGYRLVLLSVEAVIDETVLKRTHMPACDEVMEAVAGGWLDAEAPAIGGGDDGEGVVGCVYQKERGV